MLGTDKAAYMQNIWNGFSKPSTRIRICVLHVIHLLVDAIEQNYSILDSLVANIKNIFAKSS